MAAIDQLRTGHVMLPSAMTSCSWLSDIVLVNDSPNLREPGDVTVFRNFDDARRYHEHWSEEPQLAAMFATGEQLIVAADDHGNISMERRLPQPEGEDVVRMWLRRLAESAHAARLHRSTKRWGKTHIGDAERDGVLPETTEGLIAYIGFTI